ncbi:MAG: pyridoxamine 5'-phosphate oxidase family protein [Winogradskyella sp.]|uniref:pyridoxamine 5'-phosphate oxidase family protein n=1 Tax=Winogradskyella sp. TaxID=1883156 RepID=UPI00385E5398
MTNQFLEEAKRELINGHSKKRHPFRYFVLATNSNAKPTQRTVVLRKTLPDLSLVFYTDSRTQKLIDLKNNSAFSALFYHPKKLMQLRIEGQTELITDTDQIATYWHTVQEASKNDYTTQLPPGTPIQNPDDVNYQSDDNYFCPVKLVPTRIEYLRLKRPNHLRILFTKNDMDWLSEFLVP